jgi:guanylate kinase
MSEGPPVTQRAAPVVLVATSGTGKTTLARRLVEASDRYVFSISATTRPPRQGEREGIDYHFLSEPDFQRRVDEGAFAEWARVHGRLYGTPRAGIERASARGEHVVLDIDVQGARQIRRSLPEAKLIFVLPPSLDIMMARLVGRGTEDPANIARRLRSALDELQAVREFDHVVVNDDLKECLEEIRRIVEGGGPPPEPPAYDVGRLRAGIERLIREDYQDYLNEQE